MWSALDGVDERVIAWRAEGMGEPLQVAGLKVLVWKRQHLVIEPCVANLADGLIGECAGKIDAGNFGSAGLVTRGDANAHSGSGDRRFSEANASGGSVSDRRRIGGRLYLVGAVPTSP